MEKVSWLSVEDLSQARRYSVARGTEWVTSWCEKRYEVTNPTRFVAVAKR
jgi:hypothetical protein